MTLAAYPGLLINCGNEQFPALDIARSKIKRSGQYPEPVPVWPCSRWGLPGRKHLCLRRWSLTPPFHPYHYGGMSLWPYPAGCPAPGVTRHRALWSADFPQLS